MNKEKMLNIWIFQNFEKPEILKNNMNYHLIKEKDVFYFKKNINQKIKVYINFNILHIDEDLIDHINKILPLAAKKAKSISLENMDCNTEPILDLIKNILNKFLYTMEENQLGMFDFFSELLFRILISHKLLNGNKRMGWMTLIYIMRSFGYHLQLTKIKKDNKIEYSKYYEKFLINIIKEHHIGKSDEIILKKIKKTILKHTVIDIKELY